MNIIYYISNITIPIILVIILMHGYIKNVDLFDAFISGAYDGLKTTASILPSLIGLITAVGIFRSSGAMDFLCKIISPISHLTGFPSALVPMSITKMFSSSAATGMLLDIFKTYGPDSFYGISASIIMSSTETIFYTLSVYSSAAGISKSRYTVLCAIIANVSGIAASYILTCIFFANN